MAKKTSVPTDDVLLVAVNQFAQQALADGCNPAELSCALTAVALRIGLDLAPNAGLAFAVVMKAANDAAGRPAESLQRRESTMQFKRKSNRDRRNGNVAAERQRSLPSRDVSALQAAFRRCHCDSEFRARFIANCRIP
jgi:hypothetical protein